MKTPPHDTEAERAVLGAILLNPESVAEVLDVLHGALVDVFYEPAHAHVYEAMLAVYNSGRPIDAITVRDKLRASGNLDAVGGLSFIADLSSTVPTSANVAHYAKIVADKAMLRNLIRTGTRMVKAAMDNPEDVDGLLDNSEADLFQLGDRRQSVGIETLASLLPSTVAQIEANTANRTGCAGISTGFRYLDNLLTGLKPADLIILAARPSVGKTAFALNLACRASMDQQKGVLIFSLEMSKAALVQRILCARAGVNSNRMRSGFLAGQEVVKIKHAADDLGASNIFIDDSAGVSSMELRAKARRCASRNQIDLIIVDYLQLMTGSTKKVESRQVEIAEISRHLKAVARELNVPVVALSQLSRAAESDEGRPRLHHLRESGAIEQDADVAMLMYRAQKDSGESKSSEILNIDLAKQRNGPTGLVQLVFEKDLQRFGELAAPGQEAESPRAPVQEPEYDFGDETPF